MALSLGCGITATTWTMQGGCVGRTSSGFTAPARWRRVIEGAGAASLDETRVRRRLGNPAVKGVWFPVTSPPVRLRPENGAREQP